MKVCAWRLKDAGEGTGALGAVREGRVFELGGPGGLVDALRAGTGPGVGGETGRSFPLDEVRLLAPAKMPGKIVAAIVNTRGMLGGDDVRLDRPRLDMKAPSAVIGNGEPILAPAEGVRPEVELAAIVGKRMSHATPREAKESIWGYTILNDVTAPSDSREDAYEAYRRDRRTGEIAKASLRGPLFRSKNHDTFCPMGPWAVTSDEMPDVTRLRMTTAFGGKEIQDGSTAEYIFAPWDISSYVSGFLSLDPGDVVSCGSVGWTHEALGDLDPTEFVLPQVDGVLELRIEGIGTLSNPVRRVPGRIDGAQS